MQLPDFIQFLTTRHPEILYISIHTHRTGVKSLNIAVTEWTDEPDLDRDIWEAQKDIGVVIHDPYLIKPFPKETVISSGKASTSATGGRDFEILFFRN